MSQNKSFVQRTPAWADPVFSSDPAVKTLDRARLRCFAGGHGGD